MIEAGNVRTIRDQTFEVVIDLVHLESLVTSTNDVSLEIQSRIQTAIIVASSDCIHNCSRSIFAIHQIHYLKDLDPPGPTVWH
jgi:hypothetical protein